MDKLVFVCTVAIVIYVALDVGRDAARRLRRWRACRGGHRFEWARIWDDYAVDPIGVGVVCSRCGAPAEAKADWPHEPGWATDFRSLHNVDKAKALVARIARDEAYEVLEDIEHADKTSG